MTGKLSQNMFWGRYSRFVFLLAGLLTSFLLHFPLRRPIIYSDLIGVYFRVFGGDEWYNPVSRYGLPYINYRFEYPPFVGFLWTLSTFPRLYFHGINALYAHYIIQSAFIGLSSFLLALDLTWLEKRLNSKVPSYLLFMFPSFIVYGIYNWDIIAIALAIRGLKCFLEEKKICSGILFALAGSTKIFPGLFVLAVLREEGRKALSTLYFAIITGFSMFFYMFIHPKGFTDFIDYHLNWIIEGSWWLLLAGNPQNNTIISLSKLAIILSIILMLVPDLKGNVEERLIVRSWLITSVPLLFSYIYSPQMNLLILPIALLLATPELLFPIILQDISAAIVILTWFSSENPLDIYSIPSIASYIKCLLLALVAFIYSSRYMRLGKRKYDYKYLIVLNTKNIHDG